MPVITGKIGAGLTDDSASNGMPRTESDLLDVDVGDRSSQTISQIESAAADDLLGLIGGSPKQLPSVQPSKPSFNAAPPSNDILGLLDDFNIPTTVAPAG